MILAEVGVEAGRIGHFREDSRGTEISERMESFAKLFVGGGAGLVVGDKVTECCGDVGGC